MSDAAHGGEPREETSADETPPGLLRPRVQAWGETPAGLRALSVADAVAAIRKGRGPERPPVVWIDITAPGPAEAAFLTEELGFHPLAVEDTVRGRQRPKLDRYPGYLFMVVYEARINPARHRMALDELHAFVGDGYVVTVHDRRHPALGQVLALWRTHPARFRSTGMVTHALLDTVVDGYFPVLDHFAERVSELEAGVVDGAREAHMRAILRMRRELVLFRRIVGPEREMVGSLLRRDIPLLEPEMLPYFQDVHDHAIRAAEEIDTLRDLLASALEGHRSFASHQLNETMRVMAAWAIILMAVSWIAGIYGMNFDRMPELHWPLGHGLALLLMLVVGGTLFVYFRRRRWI